FQRLSDMWRPTVGLADREIAQAIARDGIDILVMLAGTLDRNRPLVAAYKPAPLRVSFHDPATSGLAAMDYLIADPVLAPRCGAERFTERVVRLPSFYIHDPLRNVPDVGPLPLQTNGAVTFGCFNNPAKLSETCLRLWARVMQAMPRSRLLLKFRSW